MTEHTIGKVYLKMLKDWNEHGGKFEQVPESCIKKLFPFRKWAAYVEITWPK
jgi:hypothetical protein